MSESPIPRMWTDAELERDLRLSREDFIAKREDDGTYAKFLAAAIEKVRRLMEQTDDLATLHDGVALLDNPLLLTPARALCGPPISEDDFATLSGVRRLTQATARVAGQYLSDALDPFRAPWIAESRPPTCEERTCAILATATVIAAQMTATSRRSMAGRTQEAAVRALIASLGYTQVSPRDVRTLRLGEFCAEVRISTKKSDVSVRLRNGDLLLIECKETNSEKNSIKRVSDCTDKQTVFAAWAKENRERVFVAGMVGGVIKIGTLKDAQTRDLFFFWNHNLEPLADFVRAACG